MGDPLDYLSTDGLPTNQPSGKCELPWYCTAPFVRLAYWTECKEREDLCDMQNSGQIPLPTPPSPGAQPGVYPEGWYQGGSGVTDPDAVTRLMEAQAAAKVLEDERRRQFVGAVSGNILDQCKARAKRDNPLGYQILGWETYCTDDGTSTEAATDYVKYAMWAGAAFLGIMLLQTVASFRK